MNPKQQQVLDSFLKAVAERGLPTEHEVVVEGGKAMVQLTKAEAFPLVTIGKQGGLDMPAVKSYPQDGVATAFDACVWGDWHVARQAKGRKAKGEQYPYPVAQATAKAVAA